MFKDFSVSYAWDSKFRGLGMWFYKCDTWPRDVESSAAACVLKVRSKLRRRRQKKRKKGVGGGAGVVIRKFSNDQAY